MIEKVFDGRKGIKNIEKNFTKIRVTCLTKELYEKSFDQLVEYFKDRHIDLTGNIITYDKEKFIYNVEISTISADAHFVCFRDKSITPIEEKDKANNFIIEITVADTKKFQNMANRIYNSLVGLDDYVNDGILLNMDETCNKITLLIGAETNFFPYFLIV